jgi:hypothetical protein
MREEECYLNPPVNDVTEPYMLARFHGSFSDLTRVTLLCLNNKREEVSFTRQCPDGARLRFTARNGTFSNPLAGNPTKTGEERYLGYETWHLHFAGGEEYDPNTPYVKFIFWCSGPDGVVAAEDPDWYRPEEAVAPTP